MATRLDRIAVLSMYAVYCYRPVCRSAIVVSPTKTAEPIEMPFRLRTQVCPWNHVLDGCLDSPGNGQF